MYQQRSLEVTHIASDCNHPLTASLQDQSFVPSRCACVLRLVGVHSLTIDITIGIPHASIEDDIYQGRFIPGGAMVISNIWFVGSNLLEVTLLTILDRAMMRDEHYFPDPDNFNPDRFLSNLRMKENEHVPVLNTFSPDDPSVLVFGFGRR